jgi:vacuolar-type H+-ATPase subunit C/Vma6
MQTQYIYSASRVNTLVQYLLTMTDINRLLVAAPGDDLESALKETYLAPYVLQTTNGDIAEAIETTLIEAKVLLRQIAPQSEMLRVLWVQFDIHNLRVFSKAVALKKGFADIEAFVSARGIYEPSELFEYAEQGTLSALQSGWQEAFDVAVRYATAGEINRIDAEFDQLFFGTASRIANAHKDRFIQSYVKAVIDLYNIKARLRVSAHDQIALTPEFAAGGTIAIERMDTKEAALQAIEQLGGAVFWKTALAQFASTGNTTHIDARADEYLLQLAKDASADMFSSASLVLYYLQTRQAAANVRTIVVGKNSGMSEAAIRSNLRLAYVNN